MRKRIDWALFVTLTAIGLTGCAAYVQPAPVVYRPAYYDPYCYYGSSVVVVNRGYYYGGYRGGYYYARCR